jgi:hypothetical protein
MANHPLITYLNDHLAGSSVALNLLDHLVKHSVTADARDFFRALRADIRADRATLEHLLRRAGGGTSPLRQTGGWLAERLARLKLTVEDPSGGSLYELEALELLGLGVEGKRALWKALAMVPVLGDTDFDTLGRRADDQRARIEERRIQVARDALSDRGSAAHATKEAQMEADIDRSSKREFNAYRLLRGTLVAAPIFAGIDKFTDKLGNWDRYLADEVAETLPVDRHTFMQGVGLVEIAAGLLVAAKPKWGGYVVGAWLLGIVGNLSLKPEYRDIALRDLGLAASAFALATLAGDAKQMRTRHAA